MTLTKQLSFKRIQTFFSGTLPVVLAEIEAHSDTMTHIVEHFGAVDDEAKIISRAVSLLTRLHTIPNHIPNSSWIIITPPMLFDIESNPIDNHPTCKDDIEQRLLTIEKKSKHRNTDYSTITGNSGRNGKD